MMQKLKKAFVIVGVLILSASCGTTRVVFVDTQADLVRLGPNVSGKVYFRKGGEWVLSKNKVKLPEGWYAGGLPKEEN